MILLNRAKNPFNGHDLNNNWIIFGIEKNYMKKLFLLLVIVLVGINCVGQNPTFQWAKSIGGPSNDIAYAVAVDLSGNVVTTGWFWTTVDFDPGPGTYTLAAVANQDIYISKLDAAGNFLWAKSIGGVYQDLGKAITTDADGNIYVTGYFYGTDDFNPGPGVYSLTSVNDDLFVLKLDAAGNFVWAKQFDGGQFQTIGNSIVVDDSKNVYITGSYDGVVDFNPGPATNTLAAVGSNDIFISKLDSLGNYVWAKSMGGVNLDRGESVVVDSLGYVYATGFFANVVDFDPGMGVNTLTATGTSTDIFITKLDPAGNFVWAKSIGNSGQDHGNGIALDSLGNLYTTGYFENTVDFDSGIGTGILTSAGGQDAFVLKLDTSGNYIWAKGMGGSSTEVSNSIAVDAMGNIYTTGGFYATADFDPSPLTTNTLTSAGDKDIFISKLDSAGNFVWVQRMGQTAPDVGNSIALGANASIYTGGTFYNTVDFDPGPGTTTLTSVGYSEAFIHKMIQCNAPSNPINTTPIGDLKVCQNQSANLVVSSPDAVTWYAAPTSTAVLNTGLSYTTSLLSPGLITFYASATNTCTSSNRTPVTVTVNPNPIITVNSGSICSGSSFTMIPGGASSYTYSSGSSIVSPTMNLSYSVTGTSTFGCVGANTAISSITVNALSMITVNSGSVCYGNSFTITPNGANTYSYSGGSAIVTPTADISYSVTGTSSLGCISASAAISSVTVNALPMVVATTSSSLLCNGETAVLSVTGASSYTWNTSEITTTISVTPTVTTSYTVNGIATNGCSNVTTITQSVGLCTDIDIATTNGYEFIIYPNPTNGLLTINSKTDLQKIEVISITGQVLLIEMPTNVSHTLDLENFVNGIYFVNVYQNNRIIKREKVVLSK